MGGVVRELESARVVVRRMVERGGWTLLSMSASRWFDRPAVLDACARAAIAEGSEPLLCLIERHGHPVFALPLRTRRRLGLREALPLSAPLAQDIDGIGAAPTRDELAALWRVLRTHYGVDLLTLRKLRADGILAVALREDKTTSSPEIAAPYIDLAAFGGFSGYEASFSSKTRRARRQRRQAAEKSLGPLSFSARTFGRSQADLGILQKAFAWKREWLAALGDVSAVIGTPWEGAIADAALAGGAILSTLRADGRPVAVELGLPEGSRYQAYFGAFDPRLDRYSLGQVQMLETIAWCYETGFSRYDLLAPPDPYKLHWTRVPTAETIVDLRVALSHVGRVGAAIETRARSLAKRAAAPLPSFARSALARLS